MSKRIAFFAGVVMVTAFVASADEYDIVKFYERIDVEDGTKAVVRYGDVEEVEFVLQPAHPFRKGTYEVSLTKESDGLYRIDRTPYYLETKFCYEWATMEEAVIVVESTSDYASSVGRVIFVD